MNRFLIPIAAALALQSQLWAQSFPDTLDNVPAGWTGPVFHLSQNYPTTAPLAEKWPWLAYDPKTQPSQYIQAVLTYCLEGNVQVGWESQNNAIRKWYHAPWMHTGNAGREFIHGLTRERTSRPHELHPSQSSQFQNWAVSVYNPQGGYTLGQVWKDPAHPDPAKALFPEGSVSVKLLFTQGSVSEVPYLKGSIEWDGNIHDQLTGSTKRVVQKLRLLQVDVGVRDSRVDSTTGWVFGTFVFDGDAPGTNPWEHLIPVGLMWGNDPAATPETVAAGEKLVESWINPNVKPPQHLGWAGRLDGPVDNPASSCLSCHSTSESPMTATMVPPSTLPSKGRLHWFRNIKSGQPFTAQANSLDYSLQLAVGIDNFNKALQTASLPPGEAVAPFVGATAIATVGPTRGGGTSDDPGLAMSESFSPQRARSEPDDAKPQTSAGKQGGAPPTPTPTGGWTTWYIVGGVVGIVLLVILGYARRK